MFDFDLCFLQVSSTKGIISHLFNLNVLVPQAHILGAKEYHVQRGTVISLVCIIENVRLIFSKNIYCVACTIYACFENI